MSLSREEIIRMAREAGLSVNHMAEPPKPYDQIAGYGDARERASEQAMAELTQQSQELGMGYE